MSRKVALLIGVNKYGEGIPSLSAPFNDVAAMRRVLKNPKLGGFDEIKTLTNPDPIAMRLAVHQIFANCRKDDLVLLFFSGHGITDDNNRLYLATKGTSKDFYKATSVPASFIQDISLESYAKRQVIVLDCCYSGAFAEGWQTKSVGIDLKKELGAEGRVVLTSSTATQTSFQQEDEKLSLYTQFLVEGIETGAADKDGNGKIYAYELHDYAKAKVQEVKPKQKPGIIIDKEGFNILLSQAPANDPEIVLKESEYQQRLEPERLKPDEEERLRQQQQENIPSPSQPRQAGILSSKKARRSVLVGSILAGLGLIGSIVLATPEVRCFLGLQSELCPTASSDPSDVVSTRSPPTQPLPTPDSPQFPTPFGTPTPSSDPSDAVSTQLPDIQPLPTPDSPQFPTPSGKPTLISAAKGVDPQRMYNQLREFLATEQWRKANEQTLELMLQVGDRDGDYRGLTHGGGGELSNFPCSDLKEIDNLWLEYSGGHFGFSVQKKIYDKVKRDPWETFRLLGWTFKFWPDQWSYRTEFYRFDQLIFSLDAEPGHLPFGFPWIDDNFWERAENCGL